eukprot:gene9548-11716_t
MPCEIPPSLLFRRFAALAQLLLCARTPSAASAVPTTTTMTRGNTMESTSTLTASAAPRTTSQRIKSIFSGSVGNLVEWYDWYVYAAFSLYFAKAFFPQGDLTAQLLNTAAIFAVGFLMRPIGGWLMGIYADRKGRKAALLASVLLMCFGSLIIALTPSYETIGIAAPILLVVA